MKTYELDEDGRYVAICPSLQGRYTEGETEAEEESELARLAFRSRFALQRDSDRFLDAA